MCESSGQREGLSDLCSVKGQDFRQTSQILFQLNSDSAFVKICFSDLPVALLPMSWPFAGRLVVQVGQHRVESDPSSPAMLL